MKLGDYIRAYRTSHDLSQRQFANACDLSNGYISILERGANPKTGKPVMPTLPQLKKLADGMNISLSDLLDQVDNMPVDIAGSDLELYFGYNIVKLAGRDGRYIEKRLTDEQLDALTTLVNQLPEADL